MTARETENLLREVVREVLHDLGGDAATNGLVSASDEPVTVGSQRDLDALVRRVLADARDPQRRRAWEQGRRRAVLATDTARPSTSSHRDPAPRGDGEFHVASGAVTERMVRAAATAGRDLTLGRRAVVTPLARERARAAGVRLVPSEESPRDTESRR